MWDNTERERDKKKALEGATLCAHRVSREDPWEARRQPAPQSVTSQRNVAALTTQQEAAGRDIERLHHFTNHAYICIYIHIKKQSKNENTPVNTSRIKHVF